MHHQDNVFKRARYEVLYIRGNLLNNQFYVSASRSDTLFQILIAQILDYKKRSTKIQFYSVFNMDETNTKEDPKAASKTF